MNRNNTDHSLAPRYAKYNISLLIISFVLSLYSCRKETTSLPADIRLVSDSGFVSRDTALSIGETIRVGIEATANGANITFFHIGWNNGSEQTLLDSGMNQSLLVYDLSITKTASESEIWEFLVMDRDRNFSSINLTLKRTSSSHYGPILTITDLVLGAQGNPDAGSFFSIPANRRYFLDQAFQVQDSVDMIYYFDQYDATLSSPAESDAPSIFTGPTGISNWTVKNETRYDTTAIDPVSFINSMNDSLILSTYEPVNLKRKAKYLLPGMIISFMDPRGKLGLIHVREVVQGASGHVLMDIKVQN